MVCCLPELKCYASIVHRILKYVAMFGYVDSDFFFGRGGGGGCGLLKIHRTFLSTLSIGMSHRQGSEFFCLFGVGGGGGGRRGPINFLKQLHTHYKYLYASHRHIAT